MIIAIDEAHSAKVELARRAILRSFASFFTAYEPGADYVYGKHTQELLDAFQEATMMLESGRSSYTCVCIPPRHGKSDVASRRFPAWFLMRNPDREVILASYNYQLATDMSFEARRVFQEVGPVYDLHVQRDRGAIGAWRISGKRGAMYSAGIGGTITGRGADFLVVDDYLKNREEAESEIVREKTWASFRSDLMTRLAPAHAVMIVANRWHQDDLVGRIIRYGGKDGFPEFRIIRFPAQGADGSWLFPERFNDAWYHSVKAFMGEYSWGAQGQQDPQPRRGNMLRIDRVEYVPASDVPKDLVPTRGWDLASTAKERMKDDPDFTCGTKVAYKDGILWIIDVVKGQWDGGERDRIIESVSDGDGGNVAVKIEVVGGYKDAHVGIRNHLRGRAVVQAEHVHRDKVSRASILEPVFEAGHVRAVKAPWNEEWRRELAAFPSGRHDDQVDSLVVAAKSLIEGRGRMMLGTI